MTMNQQLSNVALKATLSLVIFFAVLVALPTPGWAANNQGNQALQQPATLIAPKPSDKISIYPQPDRRKRRIGYGMGGDAVTILEQVGSNQGVAWHHIRVDAPPYTDGWVQEKFLLLGQPGSESKQQTANQNKGNQNKNSQDRARPYGSQNKY